MHLLCENFSSNSGILRNGAGESRLPAFHGGKAA